MPIISSILYCTPSGTKREPHPYRSKHFFLMLPTVPTHSLIARKKIAAADSREHAAAYTCSCDDIFFLSNIHRPFQVCIPGRQGRQGRRAWQRKGGTYHATTHARAHLLQSLPFRAHRSSQAVGLQNGSQNGCTLQSAPECTSDLFHRHRDPNSHRLQKKPPEALERSRH